MILERVPQVVPEDKETGELKDGILESVEEGDELKTEKFDEGKRGGAEPEFSEAKEKREFLWMLQSFAEDAPSE